MSRSEFGDPPRGPRSWALWILLALLSSACSDPSGPSPIGPPAPSSPLPPPAPPLPAGARLQMSGQVLDESGVPVAGATVVVTYATTPGSFSNPSARCPLDAQFCLISTRTGDLGRYEVEFEPRTWPSPGGPGSGSLGYVYSFREGYEQDFQWVPVGPSPAVRDLRVFAHRTILAGASIDVIVGPASSLCSDGEDLWVLQSRCEIVVIESGAGTLDVDARTTSGGPAPSLYWYTTGNYAGLITRPRPGAVSIPVRGGTYRILVGLPDGEPSQQFTVRTSLRQAGPGTP